MQRINYKWLWKTSTWAQQSTSHNPAYRTSHNSISTCVQMTFSTRLRGRPHCWVEGRSGALNPEFSGGPLIKRPLLLIRANNQKNTRNAAPTGRLCGREARCNEVPIIWLGLSRVDGPFKGPLRAWTQTACSTSTPRQEWQSRRAAPVESAPRQAQSSRWWPQRPALGMSGWRARWGCPGPHWKRRHRRRRPSPAGICTGAANHPGLPMQQAFTFQWWLCPALSGIYIFCDKINSNSSLKTTVALARIPPIEMELIWNLANCAPSTLRSGACISCNNIESQHFLSQPLLVTSHHWDETNLKSYNLHTWYLEI